MPGQSGMNGQNRLQGAQGIPGQSGINGQNGFQGAQGMPGQSTSQPLGSSIGAIPVFNTKGQLIDSMYYPISSPHPFIITPPEYSQTQIPSQSLKYPSQSSQPNMSPLLYSLQTLKKKCNNLFPECSPQVHPMEVINIQHPRDKDGILYVKDRQDQFDIPPGNVYVAQGGSLKKKLRDLRTRILYNCA
jgi:hypothetical protein